MEHTKYTRVDLKDIVTTICYNCFSKERTIWGFWISQGDRWANHLPLVNKIYWERVKKELEDEIAKQGYSNLVVGDVMPLWEQVATLLIYGYGVEIPCYQNYQHGDTFQKRIGCITLDKIISVAIEWEQERNLDWLYVREGLNINNCIEEFTLQVILKK
jgi:hypothetical protein